MSGDRADVELRRLAEAATPGPWDDVDSDVEDEYCNVIADAHYASPHNAAFIAAANPAVVLGLLDRIAQLEAERDELRAAAEARREIRPLTSTCGKPFRHGPHTFAFGRATGSCDGFLRPDSGWSRPTPEATS